MPWERVSDQSIWKTKGVQIGQQWYIWQVEREKENGQREDEELGSLKQRRMGLGKTRGGDAGAGSLIAERA
jgi:hypothetical protein